ncbi:hypothetical protein [Streptomyces sp. NPDC001652]|uniref:hypothetical protein n=1 Tax=Streptomyces sp. NPDC001652 TaxID=3154393 RepID=UPI0033339374
MSQQYPQQPGHGAPQQPTQPGYGYPQQPGWGAPPPQPQRKRKIGKALGITGAVFVGLIVIGAVAGGGEDGSADNSNKDKAVAATSDKPKAAEDAADEKAPAEDKSQAEQFKDCVAKSGTASEKDVIGHVTKVTGADKKNDILDSAEVFTDYTGGLVGPNASKGKLIASAFASCYESENGLVTVYDKGGELLSNGNY